MILDRMRINQRCPFKRSLVAVVLLVFCLLDCGVCSVDVTCESKIDASDMPKSTVCYIKQFPSISSNHDAYNFLLNYAEPTDISELEFIPSGSLQPTVESIPTQIFYTFPNLRRLRMATNLREISSESLANAMGLTSLDLSGNKLKIIRHNVFALQTALHALATLSLARNEISEIEANSFRGLNHLSELQLQRNHLKTIYRNTFVGLPALSIIDLQDNAIETIENDAFDLPALQVLYLGNNKLQTLSDVVFNRLPALKSLKLNNNELEHIGRSLYDISTVEFVSLEGNRLLDVDLGGFASMGQLKRLALTKSGFTFATTTIAMEQPSKSSLERLDIGDNNLADANELNKLRLFPKLKFLNLNGNAFTNLVVSDNGTLDEMLPSLEMLSLIRMARMSSETSLAIERQMKVNNVTVLRGSDYDYEYDSVV